MLNGRTRGFRFDGLEERESKLRSDSNDSRESPVARQGKKMGSAVRKNVRGRTLWRRRVLRDSGVSCLAAGGIPLSGRILA